MSEDIDVMDRLMLEWKAVYDDLVALEDDKDEEDGEEEDDSEDDSEDWNILRDADWESLCIGWCIAKGIGVGDAHRFYQRMISLGLF